MITARSFMILKHQYQDIPYYKTVRYTIGKTPFIHNFTYVCTLCTVIASSMNVVIFMYMIFLADSFFNMSPSELMIMASHETFLANFGI